MNAGRILYQSRSLPNRRRTMYRLCEQVYPVSGAAKDCIYDLKQRRLWQIGKDTAALLRKCITDADACFSDAEKEVIKRLIAASILEHGTGQIHTLCTHKMPARFTKAWIEITTVCNLRCMHCYNGHADACTMSLCDFRHVCAELMHAGIQHVQIIGGEPFCHPQLRDMLLHASTSFAETELFTNGTQITDEWCAFLKAHGIRTALSVYSYLPEMHDAVTGVPDSHTRTEQAIAMLSAHGVPFRTAAIRMKGIAAGTHCGQLYRLDDPDIVRMSGRGSLRLLDAGLLRDKLITKETFRRPPDPERVIAAVSGNPCFSRRIYIAADLTVYPCVMERRISHGNLRTAPLTELLDPEICNMNRDKIPACKCCEFRYACPACLPDSLQSDPLTKPYFCTYDPQTGEWADAAQFAAELLRTQEQELS